MADIETFSIAKLDLAPGDILVVRTAFLLPQATAEAIVDRMRKVVGQEQRVIVLDGGLDLAVLRPGDEEMG